VFVGATNELFLREDASTGNITGADFTAATSLAIHAYIPVNELSGNVTLIKSSTTALKAGDIVTTSRATCPTGTVAADGTSYTPAQYPQLYAAIGITHGGVAGTSFNVPDYRGRFLRGVDGGIARDPNRATRTAMNTGGNTGDNVGSVQTDSFQGHFHNWTVNTGDTDSGGTGEEEPNVGTAAPTTQAWSSYVTTASKASYASDGTNGTPRTSTETRPTNAYVTYCIRTEDANVTGSFSDFDYVAAAAGYTSGTQAITTGGSSQVVLFNNEQYDTRNAYDPATGLFTVPTGAAGWYHLSCSVYFENIVLDSGEEIMAVAVVNGKNFVQRQRMNATSTYRQSLSPSGAYYMSEGSTAFCSAYQGSGASFTLPSTSSTGFSIYRIPGQ
jgi:microcystin-dependent protein